MAFDRRALSNGLGRHRRAVSAACAALAILCLGLALRPPQLDTVEVTVAAGALPAGHRLTAADLRPALVARALAPAAGTDAPAAQLVGRVLAAPVRAGEPLGAHRLVRVLEAAWPTELGNVVLPVRFDDAGAVDLLDAGHRLDVLASSGASIDEVTARAQVVADDVPVLAVIRGGAGESEETRSAASSGEGPSASDLVLLAVTRAQALAISAATSGGRLGFVLSGPTSTS